MSDFFDLILRRESCRRYAPRPVEREKVEACLKAARLSPSACNSQPWHFYAADDPATVARIAEAVSEMGGNSFSGEVPVFVVVTEEPAKLSERVAASFESQAFAQIDVGLATAHFVLAAAEQGLGSCILGWFDPEKLHDALSLPERSRVRLVLCLGYPADGTPRPKMRKEPDEAFTWLGKRG